PSRVGRLNYISGAVSFAPGEAPDQWIQGVLNRPFTSGDRLWTDSNARAELHVGSTALRLAALTSVDMLNLDDQTIQLRLAQGAINLRVRDLARDEIIEVATPTGAVLIRQPGSYRISSEPQADLSRVSVNFGQAEVITPTQTVTVPSNQSAVIPANAGVVFEVVASSYGEEFDRWSAERDRREDRATAIRYVSRDMTGYEDLDQYGSWQTLPEYGSVWIPANVAPGWAPYRHGHWVWVSPWGWTWVDDAPWGFAPFHYGRWVWVDRYWAWAPGPITRRPVYAPALVAFVGGSSFSVSARSGPAVGWFPLGWREPYIPWYRASESYVRNVNFTHVSNAKNIYNARYANRDRPDAVTVVSQQAFVSARPVARSSFTVSQNELARAHLLRDKAPAEPIRASIAPEHPGHHPPAHAVTREVVAITPPASPVTRALPAVRERRAGFTRPAEAQPRVRVLQREGAHIVDRPSAPQLSSMPAQASAVAPSASAAPALHPRSAPAIAPAPPSAAPGVSGAEHPRAAPRIVPPGARAPHETPPPARLAERHEPRQMRGAPSDLPARGAAIERERSDSRPQAVRQDAQQQRGSAFTPARVPERSADSARLREAPRDRPVPPLPQTQAPNFRARDAVSAPRIPITPAPVAVAPSPHAQPPVTVRQDAARGAAPQQHEHRVRGDRPQPAREAPPRPAS
ncbi:MAG: DUF6600 domain-containing protein, partial [Burkholderiales bacterium]